MTVDVQSAGKSRKGHSIPLWRRILNWFKNEGPRWVRYLYFLRFALLLWLFAPGLCAADLLSSTLTSGVVTPETWEQYFCLGFFVVSASLSALVIARVVALNGPERWDRGYNEENDARPSLLVRLLGNNAAEHEVLTLLLSQIPTGLVYVFLCANGSYHYVPLPNVSVGFLFGALLSGCFWWLGNAWYYLRFVAHSSYAGLAVFTLGKNAARTIVFPRWFFYLNRSGAPLPGKPTIEQAKTVVPPITLGRFGSWLVAQPGFGLTADGAVCLYEAHAFATINVVLFTFLSMVIWPLTAPVPATTTSWVMVSLLLLVGVVGVVVFVTARPAENGKLLFIKLLLTAGIAIFLYAIIRLYTGPSPERFPIFATVLILATAVLYLLGGLAFFLDRFRVPVLSLIVVLMIIPRMAHLDRTVYLGSAEDAKTHVKHTHLIGGNGREEHYLSTSTFVGSAALKTPAQILAERLRAGDEQPLIVVTATGGGLHASAWTAAILAHLEQKVGPAFHQRLLLMSTVSGGSVGLLAYLRELHEGTLDSNPALGLARMESAAQCSSLEGVGWGLVYYDLPKAFVPALPYLIPPSPGERDLDMSQPQATPLWKDRTWSLRKSFERNLNNSYCNRLWVQAGNPDLHFPADDKVARDLTLRNLNPSSAIPAFTMNTTTVERGERFLLANYYVPYHELDPEPGYRARSFLATFGGITGQNNNGESILDLPLATAAQLSATFPYVSSAARVPMTFDNNVSSVHFVDGGYFDNDGTASAIEFLRYALNPSNDEVSAAGYPSPDPIAPLGKGGSKLRVLLIEIRNSGDVSPSGPETLGDDSNGTSPWNALSQLGGPLLAFWQAGHESVTGRNRTGLGLTENSLSDRLEIHRVVFADGNSQKIAGTDPLNWSLTPRQRAEVYSSANALPVQELETSCWFAHWDDMWTIAHGAHSVPAPDGKCPVPSSNGKPEKRR